MQTPSAWKCGQPEDLTRVAARGRQPSPRSRPWWSAAALVVVGTIAAAAAALCASESPVPRIKFIELGWDIPSTAVLRANGREMEQTTPFDGVMFKIEAKDDQGRPISTEAVWDGRPWKRSWLKTAQADLASCQFTRFSHHFVRFNATPGNLDWADDAGWRALADKAAHCAWLTKQGGGKGLAVDFESYGAQQFRFDAAQGRSFGVTAALARSRGAQFTQAVAQEFPEAVLLALWLNSINLKAGDSDNPDAILASSPYGLLPAFIDGMLDAAPPAMVLVDGCENGYYLDSAEEYLRAAQAMRSWQGAAIRLVSPANRAKYRQQVQAGFGFYLDMFLNHPTNHYYRGPLLGSRLARLERNLAFARDAADEYVWIYGEQCRWWGEPLTVPNSVGQGRLWEEAMPGITRAIAYTRDPIQAALTEIATLRAQGALTNLARNPNFTRPGRNEPGALPAEFGSWQDERSSTGKFAWDPEIGGGAARATGVRWGCFIQPHDVKPGETYAVRVACLPAGAVNPTLVVRWQTHEGRWTHENDDRTFGFKADDNRPGSSLADARASPETPVPGRTWQQAFGVVTVPPDTGKLVLLLNVTSPGANTDVGWFDNLALYRLR